MVQLILIIIAIYIVYRIFFKKKVPTNLKMVKNSFYAKDFIDDIANTIKNINFDKKIKNLKSSNMVNEKMYQTFYKQVVVLSILRISVKMISLSSVKFYEIKNDNNIYKLEEIKIFKDILNNGTFDYLDDFIKSVCESANIENNVEVKISSKNINYLIDELKKSLCIKDNQEKNINYDDILKSIKPYGSENFTKIINNLSDKNFISGVANVIDDATFDNELEFFNLLDEISPSLYKKFYTEILMIKILIESANMMAISSIEFYEVNNIDLIKNESLKILKAMLSIQGTFLDNFIKSVWKISKINEVYNKIYINVSTKDIKYAIYLVYYQNVIK